MFYVATANMRCKNSRDVNQFFFVYVFNFCVEKFQCKVDATTVAQNIEYTFVERIIYIYEVLLNQGVYTVTLRLPVSMYCIAHSYSSSIYCGKVFNGFHS